MTARFAFVIEDRESFVAAPMVLMITASDFATARAMAFDEMDDRWFGGQRGASEVRCSVRDAIEGGEVIAQPGFLAFLDGLLRGDAARWRVSTIPPTRWRRRSW